jgi:hypothetical protein
MLLDQVPRDRQPKAETAGNASRSTVGLPETVEHEGHELGLDADAARRSPEV